MQKPAVNSDFKEPIPAGLCKKKHVKETQENYKKEQIFQCIQLFKIKSRSKEGVALVVHTVVNKFETGNVFF